MPEEQIKTRAGYVAIVGKPNAGKSTFMNSIVGAKLSIVTPKPQTTRKRVLGIFTDEDSQMIFLDTPGILKPSYEMQKTMMDYVHSSLEEADIVLVIVDLEKYESFEKYFNPGFFAYFKDLKKPKVLLLNKIDKFKNAKDVLPLIAEISTKGIFDEIIPMSALKNENTLAFVNVAKKFLPEGEFFYDEDMLSTQPQRFFVSELIRETIFYKFEQEVPYSTEVAIVEFVERENGKWYISAEIIIERQSQKKIVIGKGGEMLKEIGERARKEIEAHLEMPVYLELFVKVREHWRENKSMLKSYGY